VSTVDRVTAEKIAAGQYKQDHPAAILFYHNMFNGGEAFKVLFSRKPLDVATVVREGCRIATDGRPPRLWWSREGGRTDVA